MKSEVSLKGGEIVVEEIQFLFSQRYEKFAFANLMFLLLPVLIYNDIYVDYIGNWSVSYSVKPKM